MNAASPRPDVLRIGCAAGFSGDRTDGAAPVVRALIEAGGPAFLIFETLAERTLALAQLARSNDPEGGYEPLLVDLLRPVLADCLAHRIRIVSNFGAANPPGAAARIAALARELKLPAPRIAIVSGDDLTGDTHRALLATQLGPAFDGARLVSANAYLGAEAIARALLAGADIVVCGRVADPSLAVGPAMAHFRWAGDDWDRLARATMAGHLLECGTQVTGGYFADPGVKDVPGMATLGYPIVEIDEDGHCVIGKPAGTGGLVTLRTVTEQLLYEVHDPAAYLTPDVTADITEATLTEIGPDRIRLSGVRGHPRSETLKINACFSSGWLAEGEISYAGVRAAARARLAAQTVRERLAGLGPIRADLIGVRSLFMPDRVGTSETFDGQGALQSTLQNALPTESRDVRLRLAMRHDDRATAERLCREVVALYTCGPAGGGGVRTSLRPTLSTESCLLPRTAVPASFRFLAP